MKKITLIIPALLAFAGAHAATVVVNSGSRGWYDASGFASSNDNYITGAGGTERRGWFTFDLSGITGSVASANLVLFEPSQGFVSSDSNGNDYNASETFAVYDVSSTGLAADESGGNVSIFNDLGTGVSFGSLSVTAANDGTFLTVTLNSAGIAALNSKLGSTISFGTRLSTADANDATSQYIFSGSNTGNAADGNTRLEVVTVVPEPATYALSGLAVISVAVVRRRLRKAA